MFVVCKRYFMENYPPRLSPKLLLIVSLALFCSSCFTRQKKCKEEYHEGQVLFGKYFRFNDTVVLKGCLAHYYTAMQCQDTRSKAITAIIQAYEIAHKYSEEIAFLDSLKDADFKYPFVKALTRNHCVAAVAIKKGDTGAITKERADDAGIIEKYIATLPEKEVNSELISALFKEMGYVLSKEEYDGEIMRYMQKYPAQKDALDMLRNNYEVFHNNGKPASVTAYPLPR